MNFLVRSAELRDLNHLHNLSKSVSLYNLPNDKKKIEEKVEKSKLSLSGKIKKENAEYLFVVEDLQKNLTIGCSQIIGKYGTPKDPLYSFKIFEEKKWNPFLKKEISHKILRLNKSTDGPTEIGGLVIDLSYRNTKEKIGRLISFSRFIYIGLHKERFQKNIMALMKPLLKKDGESSFWNLFGKKLTHFSYQEAVQFLLQGRKTDVFSLFPKEEQKFYLDLMDEKIKSTLSQAHPSAYPALFILKKIGFKSESFDPFDGGPLLQARTQDITIIQEGKVLNLKKEGEKTSTHFENESLIGFTRDHQFFSGRSAFHQNGNDLILPQKTWETLQLSEGEKIYISNQSKIRSIRK